MQPAPFTKCIETLTIKELKAMHTGSLLTRLQKLRSLYQDFEHSDWDRNELKHNTATGFVIFQKTDLWKKAYRDVKDELAQREHIPRGSKEKRQEAAKNNKHR